MGGRNAAIDEFPWVALLKYYKNKTESYIFSCGGTLISQQYVLSAAHCVIGEIVLINGKPIAVRLGEYDLGSNTDCNVDSPDDCVENQIHDIDIEMISVHNGYVSSSKEHDISLIRLKTVIKFDFYIRPICLPMSDTPSPMPGTRLTVSGFGRTVVFASPMMTNIKQILDIPVFDHKQCDTMFKDLGIRIQDSQICAGGQTNADACTGDSGGPLAQQLDRWYLIGLVSFGNKCGQKNWPGVYTFIPKYINWIKENMKP